MTASARAGDTPPEACALSFTESELRYLDAHLADLTPREREVTVAVCEGGDHEVVAARLCIAVPTLRTHLMRIHQKLGAENKADIVRFVSARLLEAYRTRSDTAETPPISITHKALHPRATA